MSRIQRKEQSGRSMVEMLGVLAIIGVLSVGGIAGYRYAMTRIEVNNILEAFRFIHMATFAAYHKPNSFTSCCSFDSVGLEGDYMSGCDQNGADWRAQQRDEIKSYLPASYCATEVVGYCMLEGHEWSDRNKKLGWKVYPIIRSNQPVMAISMYLPDKNKQAVCPDVIRGVISDPVYRENLRGFGTLFESTWFPKGDLSEKSIQEVCLVGSGVTFYFNLPALDQCDPEI